MIDIAEEQKLVEAAKNDLNSFTELYGLYAKKLYSFVFYMVRDHSETEDIVSNAFEKAMVHIHKYEYRGYSFGAWLFKIARNLVYDNGKAAKETSLDEIQEYVKADEERNPETVYESFENKETIDKVLNYLSDDQREIIYLRYIEEYSIKEVCDMTGRTEDSVKSLAKRGLSKIREIMQQNG